MLGFRIDDFSWIERKGRDYEGDYIHKLYLYHVSGRVLAWIFIPIDTISHYAVSIDGSDNYTYFFDLECAKRYTISLVKEKLREELMRKGLRRRGRKLV